MDLILWDMLTSIALINRSALSEKTVEKFAGAMTKQIQRDVAPAWQRYGVVYYATSEKGIPPTTWTITLYDEPQTAADAGAYGYHTTVVGQDRPVGCVFTKYAERDGCPWTTIASHEVLEMLGNEWVNQLVMRTTPDGAIEFWPTELCDAVQGQAYEIDGLQMSNFLYPGYFIEGFKGRLDHLKKLTRPFEISTGGYSSIVTIGRDGAAKNLDIYGPKYPAWRRQEAVVNRKARRGALGGLPSIHKLV